MPSCHHGQDIKQRDDRRNQLCQCGIGGIDDIGNSARALLGGVSKLLAFIAVDIKILLNAGQVLAQGAMGNIGIIRAQEIRKAFPAAVRQISSHRGDGMAQYVLRGDSIYRADELTQKPQWHAGTRVMSQAGQLELRNGGGIIP